MIVVYESVHLVIRLGGITSIVISERGSASARGEDVELVALRVGQARPRDVALADVDVGGAESAQSTVTAATGPVSRPPGQGASTQNSLPSGSARTVHETSPWPTSAGVAPRSCRRATRSA